MLPIEDGGRFGIRKTEDRRLPDSYRTQTNDNQNFGSGVRTRREEVNQQADIRRIGLERQYYQTENPVPPRVQTPEQQARIAAQEVQDAYNAHPNFVISAPGQGRDPNEPWAQEAAAQRLREVTENQPPEVVALIVEYSKPTIDLIGNELNRTAERNDGGYGDYKPEFDNVINDLAIVANRAAQAPNGSEAVSIIAESVASRINPDDIGRFDEALGKTVENGNPELAAEVISQLQAAGRTDQADDILGNVEDAINNIRGEMTDAVDDAAKYNEELGWLIAQWQPLMSEEQLTNAIKAYKTENPEYVEALNRIDAASVDTLRALTAFQDSETNFAGLGHADDVAGAIEHLFGEEKVQFGLSQSQAATAELARLLDRSENDFSARNVLDGIISVAGRIDDGATLTETIFNKTFDFTIDRSLSAAQNRNIDAVTTQINRLERYADRLGYSSPELRQVFHNLDRVARSTSERQAQIRLNRLSSRINVLEQNHPGLFGEGNKFGDKFRRFGLILGAVGTASSVQGAITDPNAMNIAGALIDSAGLTTDVLSTKIVTNLLQNRPWFSRLPIEGAGKLLGGVGLVLDAVSIANDIRQGNYTEAGISGVGAAGGALAIFGTTAAATGIGLVLVGGALLGSYLYGNVKEANKHETDGAQAFLQGAGINSDLANELINNDNKGRSAAPVFVEMANRLGVEPQEMFGYLSTLEPDDAKKLIETAHGVDPNDEGDFPESVAQPRVRGYEISTPNDVNDLIGWMRENGYGNAPGL